MQDSLKNFTLEKWPTTQAAVEMERLGFLKGETNISSGGEARVRKEGVWEPGAPGQGSPQTFRQMPL